MDRLFFILASIALLLFFPIFLRISGYYDINGRKLSFSVKAYKWIPIIGGYIATYRGGFALHISEKKAIVMPYSEVESGRRRISFLKNLPIQEVSFTMETGAEYLLPVLLAEKLVHLYVFVKKGGLERGISNIWLREGDCLRISLAFTLRFNLFMLIRNIIKERVKVLCQTKTKKSII